MKRSVVLGLLVGAGLPSLGFAQERPRTAEERVVEEVVVVAPSAGRSGIDAAKVGSSVDTVRAEDFEESSALSVTEGLQRRIPGINVSDTQGNPFAGDVNFRGFGASGLQGAPQGIAVYLNGQRLNEAFGDTMNWDLIPQIAISRADLFTNNPVYGLNALGGAVALRMKDGFSAPGLSVTAEGGSFGSRAGSFEGGWRRGVLGAYIALDGGEEDGWRELSDAKVGRGFVDLGVKGERAELHITGAAASTRLGVVGPTPVDLLEEDRSGVYTNPQSTQNRARLLAMTGGYDLSDTLRLQGGVHYRRFDQKHLDGNDGDFERCSGNLANPLFGTLCLEDDAFPAGLRPAKTAFQIVNAAGAPIPCPPPSSTGCNTTPFGTLDRSRTASTTRGGSFELLSRSAVFGRQNNLIVGGSLDDSSIRFAADSTLAVITPDLLVTTDSTVPGVGQVIRAAGDVGYGPVDLSATNRQSGVYFSDTLDVTDRLFLTLAGRLNRITIDTHDLTGRNPDLTAKHSYRRFNPAVSLAFRVRDDATLFGGYSESNRAPTPLELGCSDPLKPCLLENSLVADPPLEQVTSKTYELGARGKRDLLGGRVSWEASAYRTDNKNDIISLASSLQGRGYFANVPGTRRQGFDVSLDYAAMRWSAFAGYSYVRAEYRFEGLLASPNNPQADEDGDIEVEPGDRLGGIPAHRFKAGGELELTDRLTLGADVISVGRQFLAGDEGNDNEKLPAYWVANARADFRINGHASLFARVDNLFDRDYETFGTYFDPEGVERVIPSPLPDDPDPRTLTPASPRRWSVGLRVNF
jgi:iron complex outermembrane recepter protein